VLRGLGGGGSGVTGDLKHPVSKADRKRDIDARVARVLAADRDIRAHLREAMISGHCCLDDETGLPR
jgi:hypothetical protein